MVVNTTIWANKFASILKKEASDIGVFDICLVNLGIRSIASSASSTGAIAEKSLEPVPKACVAVGMMLEIKGIAPMCTASLAYCSLIPCELMPSSIQASTLFRERFLQGLLISEENRKHLNQVLWLCARFLPKSSSHEWIRT